LLASMQARLLQVLFIVQCARWPIHRPILDYCGAKFPKMGDYLCWTQMNHRAEFEAATFILGGDICNHTNIHTQNYKQTVTYRHMWITNSQL